MRGGADGCRDYVRHSLGVIARTSTRQTGLAAIELVVAMDSLFLAFWLAMQIVTRFQGGCRWFVAAVVPVAACAAVYFVLLVGFIPVFGSL